MAAASWKNASTLMVVARNQFGHSQKQFNFGKFSCDYNVMMLKRSAKSSFFAKAFVFPGGAVEPADFDGSWLELFAHYGHSYDKLKAHFADANRPSPPMYSSINSDSIAEIGFRIAAIRETFEETGVLFCKSPSDLDSTALVCHKEVDNSERWQNRIHHDPKEFLEMCRQNQIYPDIWSLFEWSNWLTPAGMGGKRYDTIFYLCVVDQTPQVRIDRDEITEIKWMDPVQSVWEHVQGHIYLAPPQIYELSRMASFGDCLTLKNFAGKRQLLGTERWLPIRHANDHGVMTILPGDANYPQDGKSSVPHGNGKVNRMVFRNPTVCHLACNVTDSFGHKPPLNLIDSMEEELNASKL